jgi:tetratricopeptide (TPR) repeat protein
MSRLRVFFSHSSQDNEFCGALVKALRGAWADVWYDRDNLGPGELPVTLVREIRNRPVFLVALSKPAFTSSWVQEECKAAHQQYELDRARIILPVTVGPISDSDFAALPFLQPFMRVEAPGLQPHPPDSARAEMLRLLGLTPKILPFVNPDDLVTNGKALVASGNYELAFALLLLATQLAPSLYDARLVLGNVHLHRRRWHDALNAFERCLTHDPNDVTALVGKGAALLKLQHFDAARVVLERVTRANEQDEKGWYFKGRALHGLNRFADAIAAYDQALARRAHYPDASWYRRLARQALQRSNSPSNQHSRTSRNRSVLWIDDQPEVNDEERRLLNARGVDSVISVNTDDALSKLSKQRFNALIIDMSRPLADQEMYSFIVDVSERHTGMPVIVYHSTLDTEQEEVRQRGAFGVADSTRELIRVVGEALDNQSW